MVDREKLDRAGLTHLSVVYLVWGSTYLAIRVAVREGSGFPPFTMGMMRVLTAKALRDWLKKLGVKKGDRVAIGADVPCGECAFCEDGIGNNCAINYAMGYQFQGGFAEYLLVDPLVINYGPIHKVPDNLDYDEAAIAEPLACCINGLELSWVSLGDIVVIIGAGPVGCMMAELARYMGARKVIVSQRSKIRVEMAKKYNIKVVFVSPQSTTKSAEVIAGEIGGGIMFIDPLARSYIPNMRKVIEQLTQAMR